MMATDDPLMQWNGREFERAMDSVKERAEQAGDVNAELLWACKWFIRQITDGVLINDISKNYDAMKIMHFVTAVNRINAAIFSAEAK